MGKRLVPVLAFILLWIPVAGFALGLGSIKMNSALNQPLDADIELLDVQRGDLDHLVVRLGTQTDFDRVGAERTSFLTKIKFAIQQRADGTSFVKVTSNQTVVEPFLDFVVEARWPRGRVLREFTVLVDPPALVQEAPAPVEQARVTPPPTPQPAPQPRVETEPPREVVDNETFFRNRSTESQASAQFTPAEAPAGELVYGPVKFSDTLWGIANQMRPDDVTVNQMMIALVRQNPRAFYHNNINEMKAGYVLRIDDRAALEQLSSSAADNEVRRQTTEWRARKSGRLVQQADEPTTGQVARSDQAAPADSQPAGSSAEEQGSLKLVAPGTEGPASGTGGDVDQLRQDLLLAAEALDANRQETEDLRTRLQEMEEQLAAMQRLIMLKDNEMAVLQQQMGDGESPAMQEAPGEGMGREEMSGDEAAMEAPMEGMVEERPTPAPAPAPVMQPAPVPTEGGLVDQVKAEVMAVVDDPMSILENRLALYLVLGIVILLLLILLVVRRRSMQDGFEESILNVPGNQAAAGKQTQAAPGMGESSMVSDFAMSEMSDMSGIQADATEVDPISEADVYLAYGRHQQAEDIIRDALKETPDRHELRVKMLEIYFAAKNRDAFERQAQELHDALGDESDPLWARAVTMGHQLCPGNELFGGVSADTLKEELASGVSDSDEDLLDFDFDLDSPELGEMPDANLQEADAKIAEAGADLDLGEAEDAGLDFDMAEAKEPEEKPPEDTYANLDFDVSSLEFDLDQGEPEPRSVQQETDAELPAEEDIVSADTESAETSEPEESVSFAGLEESGLDTSAEIDFAEPDTGSEKSADLDEGIDFTLEERPAEKDADEIDVEMDQELTLGDADLDEFDMDMGELTLDDDQESKPVETLAEDLGDELSDDVFNEVDEIGTKLDLARAYVDMDDKEGARSILNEVVEEGDEEQKSQAQELLAQIE